MTSQQESQIGRMGKFRRLAEAAVAGIETGFQQTAQSIDRRSREMERFRCVLAVAARQRVA